MRRRLVAAALVAVAVGCAAGVAASEAGGDADAVAIGAPSPITPVLSARRVPALLAAPVADRLLATALDALLARQPGTACLTVAASGRPLYARNEDAALVPASLTKLVTAVAALEVLGPSFRFRTAVVAAAPPDGGVVRGDAWLVGAGDPLLATADYTARFRNQPQVRTPVEDLADALARSGVTRVEGRLLGDESRYDLDRYPDPWPARFVDQDQSGPLSALTVNDAWAAFPPDPDTRVPDETPAPEPAIHAAGVLASMLAPQGVTVAGGVGTATAPDAAVELAAVESPPLSEIVGQMLRESDNQTAELLLKEIAVARGRPGTTADGVAVAAEVLDELGLGPAAVVDGSGLAPGNQLSCALVQRILDSAEEESAVAEGLPVAGVDGTLARRFVDSPVTGRLRAKTGTLNQVTALAGYLTTVPGADVTFSYVANLVPPDVVDDGDLALQDELAAILARYPEGPSLEELGPQPVAVTGG